MTDKANPKLRLKKATGWFPAGDAFLQAMTVLPDGPFKLFVFLCLNADRQTASCQSSYQRLAAGIGKSRHTVESYLAELKAKGFCTVVGSRIPYVGSTIRIADEYWPFVTAGNGFGPHGGESYVDSVRRLFTSLGCTTGRFGPSEERLAGDFERKGIPLAVIEDAMMIGACRKYVSWLNSGPSAPIASLHYFEAIIEEVQQRPFPSGYREYMRQQVEKLARLHAERDEKTRVTTSAARRLAQHRQIQPPHERRDDADHPPRIRASMNGSPRPEMEDQKIAIGAKNS
jgi:hypothetical protein